MNNFIKHYDECFPLRKKLRPKVESPWMTKGIKVSCRKKQKLFKKYIRNPTSINEHTFKKYRNQLTQIIRNRKKTILLQQIF